MSEFLHIYSILYLEYYFSCMSFFIITLYLYCQFIYLVILSPEVPEISLWLKFVQH